MLNIKLTLAVVMQGDNSSNWVSMVDPFYEA